MSSYPTPNARDLAELELIELQGKLAELDRQARAFALFSNLLILMANTT
jgi:hypothetical protein